MMYVKGGVLIQADNVVKISNSLHMVLDDEGKFIDVVKITNENGVTRTRPLVLKQDLLDIVSFISNVDGYLNLLYEAEIIDAVELYKYSKEYIPF